MGSMSLNLLSKLTLAYILMRKHVLFRYDGNSGLFTVPSGGDGLYYFSTELLVESSQFNIFDININDENLCETIGDDNNQGSDYPHVSCSGVASLVEGKLTSVINLRVLLQVLQLEVHV